MIYVYSKSCEGYYVARQYLQHLLFILQLHRAALLDNDHKITWQQCLQDCTLTIVFQIMYGLYELQLHIYNNYIKEVPL